MSKRQRTDDEEHVCGGNCELVSIDGMEVCRASGRLAGFSLVAQESRSDDPGLRFASQKINYADPLNRFGERDNAQVAQELFQKFFPDRLVPDITGPFERALMQARREGKDLRAVKDQIRAQVESNYITRREQEDITRRAIGIARLCPGTPFEAILCAVLDAHARPSGMGPAIAHIPKIARLFPGTRQHVNYGVPPSLTMTGTNAIVAVLDRIGSAGPADQPQFREAVFSAERGRM